MGNRNEEFFSGLALDCLRCTYPPAKTLAEAEVIGRALKLVSGESVLDVACGGGRLSAVLASRGMRMVGIDQVPELIRDASRQNLTGCRFLCGDVQQMQFDAEFDASFCVGTSFGYLDAGGDLKFLERVARALRIGGRFLLQTTLVSEILFRSPPTSSWMEFGEINMLRNMRYNHRTGRLITTYRFIRGSESEDKTTSFSVYSVHDLVAMCTAVGLETLLLLNKDCTAEFGFNATHLSLIAARRG